jgi:fatty-acyl-CoA synthase
MQGLIMDYQLTIPAILRRAEQVFGSKEIVTRLPDKSFHRYTYADFARRAKQLALALQRLGLKPGDRVATLAWNHYQHAEAYFAAPIGGLVTHTLNLRLHPNDLAYIANHAGDKAVIVDESLLPLLDAFKAQTQIEHVIVIGEPRDGELEYEQFVEGANVSDFKEVEPDERAAAVMCYTSGTTGPPKGVLYSHRAIALQSLGATQSAVLGICEQDTVLPVVPLFHANAWGFPFHCALVGAKQVYPGPHLDPETLLDTFEQERVTITGGVPTIWLGILQMLDAEPDRWDLSALRGMIVGGSAAPRSMIEGFEKRHGLHVVHAWGMTEMCPLGTVAEPTSEILARPEDEQYAFRAKQGIPAPFVEIRARSDEGLAPWDGTTMGELEVRGAWISSAYFEDDSQAERWTDDGWFKTGDIVTIDPRGTIEIQDRSKDVIKSGGEWISSVALENALMGHPAVAEAAVIAIPDEKWQERPMAVVVLKEGQSATPDELREFLSTQFAKWWLPERFEFVSEIPKTAVGKFRKTALREQFAQAETPVAS